MESLISALITHARERPDAPAMFWEKQALTYASLRAQVNRFATALARLGLRSGERVSLFLGNCPEFVIAYLGIQLAGGIVVLVNTQYRQVELSHILNDSTARFCVTDAGGLELLRPLSLPDLAHIIVVPDAGHSLLSVPSDTLNSPAPSLSVPSDTPGASLLAIPWELFLASGSPAANLPLPHPDQPALLAYTSGTTGLAKGALLLQRNLLANIQAVTTAWEWSADDRLLLVLPLFHAHGLMVGLHGTLFSGGSFVLRRKFEASEVLPLLKGDPGISLFFGVPTMYTRLLAEAQQAGAPDRPLRLYVSGSAPLSAQLFADFARVFGQDILERYGMTETIMNLTNPYRGERRPGTVGAPFPGQEARVVDISTRQPLLPDAIGEIEVRGPHVFAGYWRRPEATAEALARDGWFRTGDLGCVSSDGYFTITGRARELIISGGYNIYPREVEDVLATHPAVAEVAVVGRPDPDMGEHVAAAVVLRPGQTASAAELIAFCRAHLASYKKPRQVVFLVSLPRNALGKVQKHLLDLP